MITTPRRVPAPLGLVLVAALATACAPVPRPDVLADLEKIRSGAAAETAKTFAADAFAHAEKLRIAAEAAMHDGDTAGAELLGERAVAAYAHAHALARIARAEAEGVSGKASLEAAQNELLAIDADLTRASADANAAELRVKVLRDAVAVQPSLRADPERERARMGAARALAMEGRILCGAAGLLLASGAPKAAEPQVASATAALEVLEKALADATATAAPIDEASRVRAGCLDALTVLRRAQTPTSRAPGAGDALLAEISATSKFTPSRDERGVVVPLQGAFGASATIAAPTEARLLELGKIAASHPTFPIQVVVHTDRPVSARDHGAQAARAEAIIAVLKRGGSTAKALPVVAGADTPVADPHGPNHARNARVEVLFVTPEAF